MYKCTSPSKKIEEKILFNIEENIYKNNKLIRHEAKPQFVKETPHVL